MHCIISLSIFEFYMKRSVYYLRYFVVPLGEESRKGDVSL